MDEAEKQLVNAGSKGDAGLYDRGLADSTIATDFELQKSRLRMEAARKAGIAGFDMATNEVNKLATMRNRDLTEIGKIVTAPNALRTGTLNKVGTQIGTQASAAELAATEAAAGFGSALKGVLNEGSAWWSSDDTDAQKKAKDKWSY